MTPIPLDKRFFCIFLRKKYSTYESNTKIPNPNNLRPMRDNGVLRQPDEANGTGANAL